MNPHEADCRRGRWLVRQPRGWPLFWAVLLQEGPPCSCARSAPPAAGEAAA